MKYFKTIALIATLIPAVTKAQNIIVRDLKGNVVNNDTLRPVAAFTQKPPLTEIEIYLTAQNTSGKTMRMRAKKIEYVINKDAKHGICFAYECYEPSVFISKNIDTVLAGNIDSTFSGHYYYDKATMIPSRDLVGYVFYDEDNKADSTIVYVEYNTLSTTNSISLTAANDVHVSVYPNPAHNAINFKYNVNTAGPVTLRVINAAGQLVTTQTLNNNKGIVALSTSAWAPGSYLYSLSANNRHIVQGSFIVTR